MKLTCSVTPNPSSDLKPSRNLHPGRGPDPNLTLSLPAAAAMISSAICSVVLSSASVSCSRRWLVPALKSVTAFREVLRSWSPLCLSAALLTCAPAHGPSSGSTQAQRSG